MAAVTNELERRLTVPCSGQKKGNRKEGEIPSPNNGLLARGGAYAMRGACGATFFEVMT